jgi:Fungal Zn(2)-Cys(6) binuclear cluster domain
VLTFDLTSARPFVAKERLFEKLGVRPLPCSPQTLGLDGVSLRQKRWPASRRPLPSSPLQHLQAVTSIQMTTMSHPPSSTTSPYADGGSHSDHFQGPPRKKMRKGTKSCLECRRRKIKCTFEPGRTAICNECHARGSTCIDQEHGDIQSYTQQAADQSSYSLRERVSSPCTRA